MKTLSARGTPAHRSAAVDIRLHLVVLRSVPEDTLLQWATGLYMRVLSAVLVDHGFTPSNNPGEAIAFTRGELRLEPSSLVRSYLRGELGREARSASWQEL